MRDCGGYIMDILYRRNTNPQGGRGQKQTSAAWFSEQKMNTPHFCPWNFLKILKFLELYIQNTKKRRLFHSEFNRQNDWTIQKVLVYVDFLQKSSPWICTYCQKWIDSKKKCIGRLTAGKKRANIQLSNETIHFQEAMDKLHRNYDLFLKTNKVSGWKFQVIQRRAYW